MLTQAAIRIGSTRNSPRMMITGARNSHPAVPSRPRIPGSRSRTKRPPLIRSPRLLPRSLPVEVSERPSGRFVTLGCHETPAASLQLRRSLRLIQDGLQLRLDAVEDCLRIGIRQTLDLLVEVTEDRRDVRNRWNAL